MRKEAARIRKMKAELGMTAIEQLTKEKGNLTTVRSFRARPSFRLINHYGLLCYVAVCMHVHVINTNTPHIVFMYHSST